MVRNSRASLAATRDQDIALVQIGPDACRPLVSAFAEFERDRIGKRIRQAKAKQRLDGQYSGGIRQHGSCRSARDAIADLLEAAGDPSWHMMRSLSAG